MQELILKILMLILLALTVACSDAEQRQCQDDELYDQLNDTYVPRGRPDNNVNNPSDISIEDQNNDTPDADVVDMAPEDTPPDIITNPNNNIPEECDKDRDGSLSFECGGQDCDDNDGRRSPLLQEICDHVDNNCNDEINDGIECAFYAHSGDTLYLIDPFKKEIQSVLEELPNLQDIDTHPDGTLYGVTFDGFYAYDDVNNTWAKIGDFGIDVEDPNGMAIDFDGTVFVTGQDKIYTINRLTGAASLLGDVGQNFYSSGDCVVNKFDTLFMTSKHDETQDHLVQVSRATGEGTEIGPIGYDRIFGLIAAWGTLYGLTRDGELLSINESTGEGTLIHTFENVRFYGAASTPDR